jgi:DUF2975 family protein
LKPEVLPMKNERKIRLLSRVLRYTCIVGMLISLPCAGISWYLGHGDADLGLVLAPLLEDLMGYVCFSSILFLLARLFRLYEKLQFFSRENVRYVRQIGVLLLFSQLSYTFYMALKHYLLALPINALGFITSMSTVFILIFLSFVMFLLGYVMEEAKDLEDQYKLTI